MEGVGMLVGSSSLLGVKILEFGLALGVLGKTLLYLAVKVSFRVALEEILKIIYFQFVSCTRLT